MILMSDKLTVHYAVQNAPPPADTSHLKRKFLDIPYARLSPAQKLDIYLPDTVNGPFPVILLIHGGAFMGCDKADLHVLPALEGLKRGYAVVSINYRMSGEAKFPALVQDAKAAVQACRYPPLGGRGWGPTRGVMYGGSDYFEKANDELLLVVQTESRTAAEQIHEILSLPGVDGCFIGPNDLSVSYGFSPGMKQLPDEVEEGIQQILRGARDVGKFAGIHTFTIESAKRRLAEGFQFLAIMGDMRFAQAGAQAALAAVRTSE